MKLHHYFAKLKTANVDTCLYLFQACVTKNLSMLLNRHVVNVTMIALIACSIMPQAIAAKTDKPVRWFEMEVILFSQLGDKANLAENFTHNTPLPTYRGVRELLTDYLTPDITVLQRQLPFCSVLESSEKYDNLTINIDTITELITQQWQQSIVSSYALDALFNSNTSQPSNQSSEAFPHEVQTSSNIIKNNATNNDLIDPIIKPNHSVSESHTLHTVNDVFNQYHPIQFTSSFCQLSAYNIRLLEQSIPHFKANHVTIDTVPRTIDGIEQLASDEPYLISRASLQLHDIVKTLRLSREFKPMLHIGWRQAEPAINAKRSIPMHLFAGENLKAHYEQQLIQFEQEQKAAEAQEALLQDVLLNSENSLGTSITGNDSELSTLSAKKQKLALDDIINRLAQQPEEQSQLVAELDLLAQQSQLSESEKIVNTSAKPPLKPSQDWSIDGLFNVHLDHYLYITADFNVANMSLSEQATASLLAGEQQAIESIRFSQNKRVISKEIHYFDHPYMGMIVQIRRYKRPTAEEIAALKSINSEP